MQLIRAKTRGSCAAQFGMSLIELMVGITVGLILLAGVVSLVVRISLSGGESIQASRLNQQMRANLDLITKELQRSGYVNWDQAWDICNGDTDDGAWANVTDVDIASTEDPVANMLDFYQCVTPVINEMGRIQLGSVGGDGTMDCILYSYDSDEDGGKGTGDFELFGFRLNNGAVQMRTNSNAGDHACNSGTWQGVTDAHVTVTSLSFTLTYVADEATGDSAAYSVNPDPGTAPLPAVTCTPSVAGALPATTDTICLWRRNIAINMVAELADDAAVTMTLNTKVKLKNDHMQTAL